MQKEDPENVKINNFQKFLGGEGAFVWAQEEKIRYYEKNLVDLRKLPMKEESNKLISEYVTKIEEIKDKLPELKIKLNSDHITYQKMLKEYQIKILPKEFIWIKADVEGYRPASKNYSDGVPISSLVFAVSRGTKGTIKVAYNEQRKVIVNLQNFEIGTIVYQWTSVRNSWYKWATVTSDDMKLNF